MSHTLLSIETALDQSVAVTSTVMLGFSNDSCNDISSMVTEVFADINPVSVNPTKWSNIL